ncbi:hypothetical protein Syun_021040 [Stephania yunnanensis]|uniref:Uncharacterized protein n=1 Tax=Stephania yunnanensis TaxID=152371 RepID=A0AAP0IFV2_9MAGN
MDEPRPQLKVSGIIRIVDAEGQLRQKSLKLLIGVTHGDLVQCSHVQMILAFLLPKLVLSSPPTKSSLWFGVKRQ